VLRSREPQPTTEAPFVQSELEAPDGLLAGGRFTREREPAGRA